MRARTTPRRLGLAAVVAAAALSAVPAAAWAANGHANYHAVCPAPPAAHAHCHALVVADAQGNPFAATSPTGLAPATIESVYGFPTSASAGVGQTIAIVDAYDDPTAESDLGVFSSQYGLPPCTTANGCFSKVDQTGGSGYPQPDSGWALEISLDVQWAHAIAPGAKILLVEASSNSFSDLLTAEAYAKTHARYVSNSWGGDEFAGESLFDSYFSQSGVSFFVSAGDAGGLTAEYPSASPNVISVGGTTLHFDSSGAFTGETGWSSGGGGCSSQELANPAQSAFAQYAQAGCSGMRATPDVALDADPSSGVSVYDSTPYSGRTGWFTVGGTSASSPMWAARSADEGVVVNAAYAYGNDIPFRDITSGDNGWPCLAGYDLCTGRGSWATAAPATPTVASFGPTSGPPGTSVVILGSDLAGATSVTFAGTSASFTAGTDGSLTASVPAGATSGPIAVATPDGTATSTSSFTVTATVADVATSYQIGADHAGVQTDDALAPPLARRWVATLPNPPSYPLIAAGKVFVTVSAAPNRGTLLYALDQATGSTLWSRSIAGTYSFSAAAYDEGAVFVVNSDGFLQAFDAGTGGPLWSVQLPGQSMFTSPPSAGNGVVYVGGAGTGGTLYAVDELSGALLATQPVENGDHSSPALSGGSVFASYACDQAYGFAKTSLAPLWHHAGSCEGGGGKTPVYAGGRVYVRDVGDGNLVLDAASGTLIRSFTPACAAALAPAFDHSAGYALSTPSGGGSAVLSAQSVSDGSSLWTFSGDGGLDSAPVVLATPAGEFVVEGSSSGTLYALEAATGGVAWSTDVGAPIAKPDEQNAVQLTGLAAGQGLLVVPAGNTLSAYTAAPQQAAPAVTSFAPQSGPAGTTVTITGTGFTGVTGVTFGGTPASAYTVTSATQIVATVPAGATSGPISVAAAGGTGTSSGSFTVTSPDFSLTAAPASQTVSAGKSVTYTVAVTPSGGFSGSVALDVVGLPSGAGATFSPSTTASTSTLTVSTSRSTKPGATTLTITATSGSLVRTTTVTLQVKKK